MFHKDTNNFKRTFYANQQRNKITIARVHLFSLPEIPNKFN